MSFKTELRAVKTAFRAALTSKDLSLDSLEKYRIKFLGRKGEISDLFEQFNSLHNQLKPEYGKEINSLKNECQKLFDTAKRRIDAQEKNIFEDYIDFSLPGYPTSYGTSHPLELILEEIKTIFSSINFSIAYGNEIDDDFHNFEALNIPKHHPARDMQDTFFVDKDMVLRTHTSNVQIHLMELG